MRVPFYWCDIPNFGDALNPVIFAKLAGMKIRFAPVDYARVMGIGSLGDNLLVDSTSALSSRRSPIWLFSTGIGFEEGGFFHNPNIVLPERLRRDVRCYALRGKLTDARIAKMLGHPTGAILGDAGLLVCYLIDADKVEKKYELGIVPHYADRESPIFAAIKTRIHGSRILDPTRPVERFLHDLCECKAVISTAMHPLIACDALRIPNQWIRISEKTTSRYKFYDYYSAFGKRKEPLDLTRREFCQADLDSLVQNYDIGDEEVFKVQEDLLSALKRLSSDWEAIRRGLAVKSFLKSLLLPFVCSIPVRRARRRLRVALKY